MAITSSTEKMISDLIDATYGKNLTAREKYIFREALRSLVRLAKSEQMLEMKNNVRKLTGKFMSTSLRQRKKPNQRIELLSNRIQQQFEFNQFK